MPAVVDGGAAGNGRVDAFAAIAADHEGLAREVKGHLGLEGRLLAQHSIDLSPTLVLHHVGPRLSFLRLERESVGRLGYVARDIPQQAVFAFPNLDVHRSVERSFQELDKLRVVRFAAGPTREALCSVREAFLLHLDPRHDVHVHGASVLELEAHGIAVDVLDARVRGAEILLHHQLFDDGDHAVVHVQRHEHLAVRHPLLGFLVPLQDATMPRKLPLRRRDGEEQVWHLAVLSTHILELGLLVLPEHGEVLHLGRHLLGSALLALRQDGDAADALREGDVVQQALEREVLLVGDAAAGELPIEAVLDARGRIRLDVAEFDQTDLRVGVPERRRGVEPRSRGDLDPRHVQEELRRLDHSPSTVCVVGRVSEMAPMLLEVLGVSNVVFHQPIEGGPGARRG
eukprot:16446756-Heterocapsa_arctica.AAC.1